MRGLFVTILIATLGLNISVVHSHGALLETSQQLELRYGKTFKEIYGGAVRVYQSREFTINVNFVQERSLSETYFPRTRRTLTQQEIDRVLQLNSLGSTWVRVPGQDEWKLKSGRALARLSGGTSPTSLEVLTSEYEAHGNRPKN